MSKLSRLIKNNQQLKSKITTEIKNLSSDSSLISAGKNIKISGEAGLMLEDINTKISSSLKSANLISVPSIDGITSVGTRNIGIESTNPTIEQVNSRGERTDDGMLIGGYRVVNTITQRDAIQCCFRKLGMIVMVVGPDLSFTEYMLTGDLCGNDGWLLYEVDSTDTIVFEDDVIITEDYTILSPEEQIDTQKDLNKLFKDILAELISRPPATGDKNYVHDQFIPSKLWVIDHPLDKKVSVTVTDTAGTEVEGKVTLNSGNQVTIEFNFPFSGEAVLN